LELIILEWFEIAGRMLVMSGKNRRILERIL
jgi:hypothetical protein